MVKKYRIVFSRQAEKDKILLKGANLEMRTKNLLNRMAENPFVVPPSFESLKGNLRGFYSRRINIQHRIVYEVLEEKKVIHILRMWTHYEK